MPHPRSSPSLVLLLCTAMLFIATPARAALAVEEAPLWSGTRLLGGYYYQASAFSGQGELFPSGSTTPVSGVRVHERHGFVSSLLTIFALAPGAVVSPFRADTTSGTTTVDHGDYLVRTNWTKTVYTRVMSDEEAARQTERNTELVLGLSGSSWCDLVVYAPLPGLPSSGRPAGEGFDFSLGVDAVLADLGDLPLVLDVGVHVGHLEVRGGSEPAWGAGGVMGKLYLPLTRFAWLTGALDLNFAGFFAEGKPTFAPSLARGGLEVLLTDRVFVRGQASYGLDFSSMQTSQGVALEAGVRL